MNKRILSWVLALALMFSQVPAYAAELPAELPAEMTVEMTEAAETESATQTSEEETEAPAEETEAPAEETEAPAEEEEVPAEETEVPAEAPELPANTVTVKLATPKNIQWSGNTLTWSPVEHATGYWVAWARVDEKYDPNEEGPIDGRWVDVNVGTSCDLTDQLYLLAAENYGVTESKSVQVAAWVAAYGVLDETAGIYYQESAFTASSSHTYTLDHTLAKLPAPTNLRWSGNTLLWNNVEGNAGYYVEVVFGDSKEAVKVCYETEYDETSLDLTEDLSYMAGDYYRDTRNTTMPVTAHVRTLSSELSVCAGSGYAASPVKQYAISGYSILPAPTGLRWDGYVLRWTAVKGATDYLVEMQIGEDGNCEWDADGTSGTSYDMTGYLENMVNYYHKELGQDQVRLRMYVTAGSFSDKVVDSPRAAAPALVLEYPFELKSNQIECDGIDTYTATTTQKINLKASALAEAKLTYKSSSTKIKVSADGTVTIPAKYVGKSTITITSAAAGGYIKTEKVVDVIVNPKLTVKDLTVSASASVKTYALGAKTTGTSKISYKIDPDTMPAGMPTPVISTTGKISIPSRFEGEFSIAVSAAGAGGTGDWAMMKMKVVPLKENKISLPATALEKNFSASAQKFLLGATVLGGAKLKYKSDTKKVSVSSTGKVTIAAKFFGTATITITSAETKEYYPAQATVTITMLPIDNRITVKSTALKNKVSARARNISLGTKVLGKAPMTHVLQGAPEGVAINAEKGIITLPAGFIGRFVVRISTGEVPGYKPTTGEVTVVVAPTAPTPKLSNPEPGELLIKWTRPVSAKTVDIQIATAKTFAEETIVAQINGVNTEDPEALMTSWKDGQVGKTYYVRMRSAANGEISPWSSYKYLKIRK